MLNYFSQTIQGYVRKLTSEDKRTLSRLIAYGGANMAVEVSRISGARFPQGTKLQIINAVVF